MNKTISIIRIAILLALGMFAIRFIFVNEQDTSLFTWLLCVIVDKALGFGSIILMARRYKRWSKIDPWFIAYDKMCDKVMEKPNPSQL